MILKENVQSQGSVYDFTNYSTLNNFIDNQNNNIFLGQTKEFKSPISTNQSVLSQNLDNINEYKYIRKNNNQYSKLRKTYDFQHSGLKNKKHQKKEMFSDSQIIEQYNRVISDQFININHNIFTQNNSKQLLQSYNSILDH